MDFIDQLRELSTRIANTKAMIQTEEATKNAMIMPLIRCLGYDVFDPTEVTPELVADVGMKKGEKVDYAVLKDGKPIILIECKKCGGDLSITHAGQLFRYFHVTDARFGVLTNGLTYRFFTDLERPNMMDEKPFFEFNILDFKERDVEELKKFTKQAFNVDMIQATASELKFTREIQATLRLWMQTPSEDFVRLVSGDLIGARRFTPALIEQFTAITRRAFERLINEAINERLKGAMTPEPSSHAEVVASEHLPSRTDGDPSGVKSADPQIVTNAEEIEGFHTIRAILRGTVPAKRVFMRDAQSYCAILLDDNNRKPICRLRFNNSQRLRVGLFNDAKEEQIFDLATVEDIFDYAPQLVATALSYVVSNDSPLLNTPE